MNIRQIIAGHLLMLVFVFPNAVSGEDFIFNVGLDLANLSEDVTGVKVKCYAVNESTQNIVGELNQDVDIPDDGNLKTNIQIAFNASQGKNPRDAEDYRCEMRIITANGDFSFVKANNTACNDPNNAWKCTKEGTPYSGNWLYGKFP
jgi:hypothetical protein